MAAGGSRDHACQRAACGDAKQANFVSINAETRRQLIVLARRKRARVVEFTPLRPSEWRPGEVANPEGAFDRYFTTQSAWEFIASKLEEGHEVEVVALRQPPGAKGYVMHMEAEAGHPPVYVKIKLGAGKVYGRSFHYSDRGRE